MNARRIDEAGALIFGGTAGIGLASATALLRAGLPRLVIVGRNAGRGAAATAMLSESHPGAEIGFLACDATQPDQVQAAVESAAGAMGRIDILVSCAGGDPMPRLLHTIPLDAVMPTIGMIAGGVILPARAVLAHMTAQGGGAIICLASDAAKVATPGETAIGAAMAAIVMFCRGMANEAKRNGIRVNCLTPSVVGDTPLYAKLKADPFAGKLFGKAETLASLGVVEAADIAAMVAFLASPAAARVTGQTISITGGISAV
ncbi:SDR family NAD(P)-dependent oxidoreductase [Phreatobacter sp.]|uniref:SDR family NAD(P)-dependent oxidoreductase n=1 Tax=Phreatobacter sp. TaxID=1966341 RepID=UPI003F6ECBE3